MENEELGYSSFFEISRVQLKLDNFSVARVIAEHKGLYKVRNMDGEYSAKITGKQMFKASARADYPAVGDWVAINKIDKGQSVIEGLLSRKSALKRKFNHKNEIQIIATNVDVAFVVESVDSDFSINRFERYLAMANDSGIKPVIILNKIDLISREELESKLTQIKNRLDNTDIITTSTVTDTGLEELKEYIEKGKTHCFLGSSGVGKSSLINKLIGEDLIKTGDISAYSNKGKHTTTSREMYFLKNGGIVIDNPGMREVGIVDMDTGISGVFDEISIIAQKCKYSDCAHEKEPECMVLQAVKSGEINRSQLSNYINLKKEAEQYEITETEKKRKRS